MASTVDQGTAFELQLRRLFEARGYQATHNVRLVGRSGAEHQIDVLAEMRLPLQTLRVIVEAKAHDQPIDKDALLKLVQIVEDVGADRGILATTSHFTPGALKMAEGRNVDLWDRDVVLRFFGEAAIAPTAEEAYEGAEPGLGTAGGLIAVVPRLSLEDARAAIESGVEKRRKGGLLGVGRVVETLTRIEPIHQLFYEITVNAPQYNEERRGLLSKEVVRTIIAARISVGANTGRVVTVNALGEIEASPHSLPELNRDEIECLRVLPDGWFRRDDLLALGFTQARAQRLIAGLEAKGLLQRGADGRKVFYKADGMVPVPTGGRAVSEAFATAPVTEELKTLNFPTRSQVGIVRSLEALAPGTTVREVSSLYYPFYSYSLERLDGAHRHEFLDAMSGKIHHFAGP